MWSGIIFLILSLLVPVLGVSKQQRYLSSPLGNIALYQGVSVHLIREDSLSTIQRIIFQILVSYWDRNQTKRGVSISQLSHLTNGQGMATSTMTRS
ncbi:hypothetical protein M378DRAFT_167584 [Amanita muscaria Koide BX008]|uniref:Uncharacterized protein n=1 Tax=Amanita muscaria (strain Koide BX008) TaxID=946122 RepID=A0A0C2WVT0_AMAMK|nr:hypothetical protein M378DRAFT_167584 [Amanita muscaria Koide BX008]